MKSIGFLCLVTIITCMPRGAQSQGVDVVAVGLNNPRGITFGAGGAVYVAEAGIGGAGPCVELPPPLGTLCLGDSGSVTRIDPISGAPTRILTGLPSIASPDGTRSFGAHDVAFDGRGHGFVLLGGAGSLENRTAFGPGGATLGYLARVRRKGDFIPLADLTAYEGVANPDGDLADSNPYGLLALPGKFIVADAAANTLVEVRPRGLGRSRASRPPRVRTLAVFAERLVEAPPLLGLPPGAQVSMDSVPTTVVRGPDRAYYVGELTGFPFPVGGANVYRVPAAGGTPAIVAGGFTNIIDMAFGPDGALYVLEIFKNGMLSGDPTGALIEIRRDGTRRELAAGMLQTPGGIAVSRDGALYVTTGSVLPGGGQVLRIVP